MDLRQPLRELQRRVMNALARAVIRQVSDTPGLQLLQVSLTADEVKGGVERFQDYGYTSVPLPGAEALAAFIGGNRDHGIVICVADRRFRLTGLAPGEVAIYDDQGQKVVLHRDHIRVTAPKVVVEADEIHLGGEDGAQLARVGDLVEVGSGSSAGQWPIVSGSDKVRAE